MCTIINCWTNAFATKNKDILFAVFVEYINLFSLQNAKHVHSPTDTHYRERGWMGEGRLRHNDTNTACVGACDMRPPYMKMNSFARQCYRRLQSIYYCIHYYTFILCVTLSSSCLGRQLSALDCFTSSRRIYFTVNLSHPRNIYARRIRIAKKWVDGRRMYSNTLCSEFFRRW